MTSLAKRLKNYVLRLIDFFGLSLQSLFKDFNFISKRICSKDFQLGLVLLVLIFNIQSASYILDDEL